MKRSLPWPSFIADAIRSSVKMNAGTGVTGRKSAVMVTFVISMQPKLDEDDTLPLEELTELDELMLTCLFLTTYVAH